MSIVFSPVGEKAIWEKHIKNLDLGESAIALKAMVLPQGTRGYTGETFNLG